ncbi:hypothetical protein BGZ74_008605 [Mortierella antarctica]|nr:hypothetical protein BGZ74_008605 [Mortierella antarctica]
MTDNHLTLFCLVDGDTTSQTFSVEIDPTKTVDGLRKAIKTEIPGTFNGIDGKDLTLWQVSIPITDDNDEIPILLDNVTNVVKKKLSPATRLSKVFPGELMEETVHIIVQRPPQVPVDCLEQIINFVDDRRTLCALLTVSKDVGGLAARRLYYDPLRYLREKGDDQVDNGRRCECFFKLVLTLSPVNDHDVHILREAAGIIVPNRSLPRVPLPQQTFFRQLQPTLVPPQLFYDYLSFVRIINWGDPDSGQSLQDTPPPWLKFPTWTAPSNNKEILTGPSLVPTLSKALVGHPHQLSRLVELEVSLYDIDHYIASANHLSSLKRLRIRGKDAWSNPHQFKQIITLVTTIQQLHGFPQLRECHVVAYPFSSQWSSEGAVKTPDISKQMDILLRLPQSSKPYFELPCLPAANNINHYSNHYNNHTNNTTSPTILVLRERMDASLARIESANVGDSHGKWAAMRQAFSYRPYLTSAQILQRLRGLRHLTNNDVDSHLFKWAVHEAKVKQQQEKQRHKGQHPSFELVQLQGLTVSFNNTTFLSPATAMNAGIQGHGGGRRHDRGQGRGNYEAVQDALFAFSQTLGYLALCDNNPGTVAQGVHQSWEISTPLCTLPRLKHLVLNTHVSTLWIEPGFWNRCPGLERLVIDSEWVHIPSPPPQSGHHGGQTPSHLPQQWRISNALMSPPSSSSLSSLSPLDATEREQGSKMVLEIFIPEDCCPHLQLIHLSNGAVRVFRPDCLAHLPSLEEINIRDSPIYSTRETHLDRTPLFQHLWTWDWGTLPNLRRLTIMADLLYLGFSFGIIKSCPRLEYIFLDSVPASTYKTYYSYNTHTIESQGDPRVFHLRIKEALSMPVSAADGVTGAQPYSHVKTICLRGRASVEYDEVRHLIQVLPGLEELRLDGAMTWDKHCTAKSFVEMTRTHPTLRLLSVHMKKPSLTSTIEELGLVALPYEARDDKEWTGIRYGFSDGMMSRARSSSS